MADLASLMHGEKRPRKSGDTIFPIINIWEIFIRSRTANSEVGDPI